MIDKVIQRKSECKKAETGLGNLKNNKGKKWKEQKERRKEEEAVEVEKIK